MSHKKGPAGRGAHGDQVSLALPRRPDPRALPGPCCPGSRSCGAGILQVSRAWALKENLRQLWTYRREGWARSFFGRWYFWATHSRLPPMVAVARTLKRRLDNILTYLQHPITNALNESVQRPGREGQAPGPRLSQPHELPDRHLLPLREARPLSATTTCWGYPQ